MDLPDFEIVGGTDKGKILVPQEVRFAYRWTLSDDHHKLRGWEGAEDSMWEAMVTGSRRLQNRLGTDLYIEFKGNRPLWLEVPNWLPAMAERHGPVSEGWKFHTLW